MSDYITLMGAEEVSRAGHSMRDAASSMNSAASTISNALEQHQRFMDDWLYRMKAILEKEPQS
jgi:hypothetical protein